MKIFKCFLLWAVFSTSANESLAGSDPYRAALPADPSQAWCEGDFQWISGLEKFTPDGAIIPIGPYYFRICQDGAVTSSPDDRRMLIFFNPRRVEGLRYDKSVELMIAAQGGWPIRLETSLRQTKLVGTHKFGGVTYETYRTYRPYWYPPVRGGKTFLYVPQLNRDREGLPPHLIQCSKSFDRHPKESMHCFLYAGYDQVEARLLFIGGGPELTPIPVEAFPEFAQDILLVLQTANVTEEIDQLREHLPVLD